MRVNEPCKARHKDLRTENIECSCKTQYSCTISTYDGTVDFHKLKWSRK